MDVKKEPEENTNIDIESIIIWIRKILGVRGGHNIKSGAECAGGGHNMKSLLGEFSSTPLP